MRFFVRMLRNIVFIFLISSAIQAIAQDTILSSRESNLVLLLNDLRAAKDDVEKEEMSRIEAIFDQIERHNSEVFREIIKEVEESISRL